MKWCYSSGKVGLNSWVASVDERCVCACQRRQAQSSKLKSHSITQNISHVLNLNIYGKRERKRKMKSGRTIEERVSKSVE